SNDVISGAVISPGGTIAYSGLLTHSPGSNNWPEPVTTHVIKQGQVSDAGTRNRGTLVGGGDYSIPHAVNDAGIVAGESHALNRWNQAFVSAPSSSGKYNPVSLGANGGTVSTALAVNDQGTVVGQTDVPGQWKNHAFTAQGSYSSFPYGSVND